MRLVKKHTDVLSGIFGEDDIATLKSAVTDDSARGWCVFDPNGVELLREGLSETVTAVASNLLDLAATVGEELGDGASAPAMTLARGGAELHAEPLGRANVLVLSETSNGFRKAV